MRRLVALRAPALTLARVRPMPHMAPMARLPTRNLASILDEVSTIIQDDGIFTRTFGLSEVDTFFNDLGVPEAYFRSFTTEEIAQHVTAYIAAKKAALMSNSNDIDELCVDRVLPGYGGGLFMTVDTPESRAQAEDHLLDVVSRRLESPEYGYSIKVFRSANPAYKRGVHHVLFYILTFSPYKDQDRVIWDPKSGPPPFTEIAEIATVEFLEKKIENVQDRYYQNLQKAVSSLHPVIDVHDATVLEGQPPQCGIIVCLPQEGHPFLSELSKLCQRNKITPIKKFVETFSCGMEVHSLYFIGTKEEVLSGSKLMDELALLILVPSGAQSTPGGVAIRAMYTAGKLGPHSSMFAYSAMVFAFYFAHEGASVAADMAPLMEHLQGAPEHQRRLESLIHEAMLPKLTEVRIIDAFNRNITMFRELYEHFKDCIHSDEMTQPSDRFIRKIEHSLVDEIDRAIFRAVLIFCHACAKTNFDKRDKSAVGFRLDVAMISKYLNFPFSNLPYAIFLVIGAQFRGFHIRFRDVARGGIRIIVSRDSGTHSFNCRRLLDENLNLAYTQQMKNKDIPEGGSKGTLLVTSGYRGSLKQLFDRYANTILDLILPESLAGVDIVDRYKREEVIFFGPDENTADVMTQAAFDARKRNYLYWKAWTTGKSPTAGGVPHDVYGMTTNSVRVYIEGIQKKLDLNPQECTKLQIGGPDGDLGSNEILRSLERTIGIVDGSGVLYDPNGLDNAELTRLAQMRLTVSNFKTEKLSGEGFRVRLEDQDIELPGGFIVDNGVQFRDFFHLNPVVSADFFVPCGGRPRSVDIKSVAKLFSDNGLSRFKYIVEGANLFFTDEARQILESRGVILFKDASANKGGVTSSSLEVLAGLALSDEQHAKLMCVSDTGKVPEFYERYVGDIVEHIRECAEKEFEILWKSNPRHSRSTTSMRLSMKINDVFDKLMESELVHASNPVAQAVLARALPPTLMEVVDVPTVISRLPVNYLKAIVACHLSSQYVYQHGLSADEVAFYEFVSALQQSQSTH